MEIERKYLIRYMPAEIEKAEKREIEQGYLCRDPVVRVRKSNDKYILTIKLKNKGSGREGNPLINDEFEYYIGAEAFEHLKNKADNHIISKTRYIIGLDGGLKAELDVFHGILEGLRFVEVEFPSLEDANAFAPPDWFGEDVTSDPAYRNGHLTTLDDMSGFQAAGGSSGQSETEDSVK